MTCLSCTVDQGGWQHRTVSHSLSQDGLCVLRSLASRREALHISCLCQSPAHPLAHLVCLPSGHFWRSISLVQQENSVWFGTQLLWRCQPCVAEQQWAVLHGWTWLLSVGPYLLHLSLWILTLWSQRVPSAESNSCNNVLHCPAFVVWSYFLCRIVVWPTAVADVMEVAGTVLPYGGHSLAKDLCGLRGHSLCHLRYCSCYQQICDGRTLGAACHHDNVLCSPALSLALCNKFKIISSERNSLCQSCFTVIRPKLSEL